MIKKLSFIFFIILIFNFSRANDSFSTKLKLDYKNYYLHNDFQEMGAVFLTGGVMANSNIDQWLRDNYQDEIRYNPNYDSDKIDDTSAFFKIFGEGKILIPVAVGAKLLGSYSGVESVEKWGDNVTRAYLLGAPSLLLMQRVTGGSRPDEVSSDKSSYWNFFHDDNGVSGHAFMGTVPFLVAANMTEDKYVKSGLYLASTLTAVSRVNDDKHFVSQAILGWYLAYSSVNSIFKTNKQSANSENNLTILPIVNDDNNAGLLVSYKF
jgi:membrane-associated phospholipid phosphatase